MFYDCYQITCTVARVPLAECAGRLSGAILCPYPPGIPVAFPGEELTAEAIRSLLDVKRLGGKVTGASDESLRTLDVIIES